MKRIVCLDEQLKPDAKGGGWKDQKVVFERGSNDCKSEEQDVHLKAICMERENLNWKEWIVRQDGGGLDEQSADDV